uniref:Uncharacterized protein n=1 Tax=Leersia perrieri TaxID=77586 RepID=A0A0D9WYD9_9ORYZ
MWARAQGGWRRTDGQIGLPGVLPLLLSPMTEMRMSASSGAEGGFSGTGSGPAAAGSGGVPRSGRSGWSSSSGGIGGGNSSSAEPAGCEMPHPMALEVVGAMSSHIASARDGERISDEVAAMVLMLCLATRELGEQVEVLNAAARELAELEFDISLSDSEKVHLRLKVTKISLAIVGFLAGVLAAAW